ncbi:MAG: COX15/CtaA family protein [Actinomycetota bacterium]|nr:COX15/CtaA family protein [Actinomycetota bacterium]MDQ6948230.1 COX15/CtaA family protein [Actinomycetota bacterium]
MNPAAGNQRFGRLRHLRLSPSGYRRVCLFGVWALGFIIVTGAAVRLTGSGLGCPDWPTCARNHLVAPWQYHAVIEFGNRVVTGAVSFAVIAAVLGSAFRRPRRRDLTWLSWGLVGGLLGQIVLGGESVRHQLAPPYIMGHFMLSLVLLCNAVVLYHRAGFDDGPPDDRGRVRPVGPATPLVLREQLIMGRLLMVSAAVAIFLGTVVTSTGPHGGDPRARRLAFSLHDVAQLHSVAVLLFLAFTVLTLGRMMQAGVPAEVIRRGEVLLVVLLAQGAVGYLQYFSGVPTWLVAIHVTLATALWAVTVQFALGLTTRPDSRSLTPAPAPEGARADADGAGSMLAPA